MNNLKVENLIPNDSHVSFYGKAKVITENVNGHEVKYLQSYETIVAYVVDGEVFRTWDGYSATTGRHIQAFLKYCGLPGMSKKEWLKVPFDGSLVTDDVLQPFNWNRVSVNYGYCW